MQSRFRTLHLALASSVAISLVVVAYLFSGPFAFKTSVVDAATAESLLKSYATKDSDADGLPDWQEALYGTDPQNPESVKVGVLDGDAVAQGLVKPKFESATPKPVSVSSIPGALPSNDSLTAQFSQEFLKNYIAAGGQSMTASEQQALLTSLVANFTARAQKLLVSSYSAVSLHTDPNVSVLAYADAVEHIISRNGVAAGTEDPVTLMDQYINNGDVSALPKLTSLANKYSAITTSLLAVHVPPSLATSHLALLRSFDTLARATHAATTYETDPFATLGALSAYQATAGGVVSAFVDIAKVILSTGEPAPGTPGSLIVTFARSVQKQ